MTYTVNKKKKWKNKDNDTKKKGPQHKYKEQDLYVGYSHDRYVTLRCSFVGCMYCPNVTQSTLASRRSVKKEKKYRDVWYLADNPRYTKRWRPALHSG